MIEIFFSRSQTYEINFPSIFSPFYYDSNDYRHSPKQGFHILTVNKLLFDFSICFSLFKLQNAFFIYNFLDYYIENPLSGGPIKVH